MTEKAEITNGDLFNVFLRNFMLMGTLNFERGQSLGYLVAVLPVLKKLYPTKEELKPWLKAHMEYFNTNPPMCPLVMGIDLAIEEKGADPDTIIALKTALSGPFAGIGDSLYWATFIPLIWGIAATMVLQGNMAGILVSEVLWILAIWGSSFWLMLQGHKYGSTFGTALKGRFEEFRDLLVAFAFVVVGSLTVYFVGIGTPINIPAWGFNLQKILNSIAPSLLNVVFVFFSLWLLRRGYSPMKTVGILFVIGLVAGALGILA